MQKSDKKKNERTCQKRQQLERCFQKIIKVFLYSIPSVISILGKDIRLNVLFVFEGKPNYINDNVFIRRAQPISSKEYFMLKKRK